VTPARAGKKKKLGHSRPLKQTGGNEGGKARGYRERRSRLLSGGNAKSAAPGRKGEREVGMMKIGLKKSSEECPFEKNDAIEGVGKQISQEINRKPFWGMPPVGSNKLTRKEGKSKDNFRGTISHKREERWYYGTGRGIADGNEGRRDSESFNNVLTQHKLYP